MTNYDPDNPTPEMFYHCQTWTRKVLNPIIDWTTEEVCEFIHEFNVPYCKLYDEGFKRLGCIGCPMAGKHREYEFERYPKFKQAYIRAFDRLAEVNKSKGKTNMEAYETKWRDGESTFKWWMQNKASN